MDITDTAIRAAFSGCDDFVTRELTCNGLKLYAYGIDGLISGSDAADFVLKPIAGDLSGDTMQALYDNALAGGIYNTVAKSCPDLKDVTVKLVNGFTVVLFPGVGAIALKPEPGKSGGSPLRLWKPR